MRASDRTILKTVEEQPEPEYGEYNGLKCIIVEFMGWKLPVLVDVTYSSSTYMEAGE